MTHIQKAMQTVGDRGRYQLILLFIFIVIYTELSLILLGSSFIYMNPVFDCGDGMDVTEDEACSRACPIGKTLNIQLMIILLPTMLVYTATSRLSAALFSQPSILAPSSDFSSSLHSLTR